MEKYLNNIMIVDGSYALHRALNTPGLKDLATKEGIKSGGIYGFLKILQSELKNFPGYFPIVCWDAGLNERRTKIYPDYKANRRRLEADRLIGLGVDKEKEEYLKQYHTQRDVLIRLLKCISVPSLLIPGQEGDDLQYLLSKICNKSVILTDDKDLIQLVSPNTIIRRAMRDEIIEWDETDTYYHHPRFTIRKSIIGDDSDNIPHCVKGLGEKTADKIALILENEQFKNYEDKLRTYCSENKGALVTKIEALLDNWKQFIINYNLIDLHLVEVPEGFETMIKNLILGMIKKNNILECYSYIGKYELNSIYPDQLFSIISIASSNVLLE